jgi:hypothetical protein
MSEDKQQPEDDTWVCSWGDRCKPIDTQEEKEMKPERYFNIIKNKKRWDNNE